MADVGNALRCPAGHAYPRLGGVPRFVPHAGYTAAFGAQWRRYRLTQLDSYTGTTISRDRARRCLGDELWTELGRKQVLEAGCGAGRFTEVLLSRGAHVTSIDMSEAVEANAENFPQDDRHRVAQADILRLPFAPEQFDIVFCLGVVQHTPSPEQTIAHLYRHVRLGGFLIVDHYTHRLKWSLSAAALVRLVLRRVPPDRGLVWTERLVDLLLPVHKRARRLAPVLGRVSPVYSYYDAFPQLPDALQREWALLDTHDALTDRYKHFRSRAKMRRLLEPLGAEHIWCEHGGNGVEARARKPARESSGRPAGP